MHQDIKEVLFSEEQLRDRIRQLGEEITKDYAGQELVLVCILRGSYIFMADLSRAIDLPLSADFIALSSYGKGTSSSGQVELRKDLSDPVEGKHLLIVEDILDSGNTLYYLTNLLKTRHPASVRICTLLNKPERREKDIQPDYVGFTIPDAFVVGYGLDYAEKYRNLPYVGVLKPEIYTK